ncbi:MAG: hypothetical protein H6962_15350 [Chromatiaceae bacterium]|nr:hypothetical protein [Chromatiaceae bacterium]
MAADEPFAPDPLCRDASGDSDNGIGHANPPSAFDDSIDGLVSYWR